MPRSASREADKESFRRVMTVFGDAVFTTVSMAMRPSQGGKAAAITKWVEFGDEVWRHMEDEDDDAEEL